MNCNVIIFIYLNILNQCFPKCVLRNPKVPLDNLKGSIRLLLHIIKNYYFILFKKRGFHETQTISQGCCGRKSLGIAVLNNTLILIIEKVNLLEGSL